MGVESSAAVVGIDLGSVTLKAVLLDAAGGIEKRLSVRADGFPARGAARLLEQMLPEGARSIRLALTGGGKGVLSGVEGVLLETDTVSTARAAAATMPRARGLIEIGGHQSKWMRLGPGGNLESFALNDQCAAGSGAFIEQQAGRLGIDVEALAHLAAAAPRGASIAGRCAVFAKSDMIHLQQKGTSIAEVAYGLCLALARNFRATLLRGTELTRPVVLLGGGALNPGLYRAFLEVFDLPPEALVRAADPLFCAALGVAMAAHDQASQLPVGELLERLHSSPVAASVAGRPLPALPASRSERGPEPEAAAAGPIRAFLGVDVGSVSTDICLLSESAEVLDGIYLATRGDPVAALREGLATLRERLGESLQVLGVGTTGSGRHLAGELLGADLVKNEITCQLLGARHLVPEVDTILEIGGQDSKYVAVQNGHIADFVMNKICAAGTGSFLEEQGEALGVSIRGEFSEQAFRSDAPADLGSQCTVFMDTEVVNGRQRKVSLPDLLSGLAYSVAKNYLERVVAGRTIGEHVVFQGGVASNEAVVAALEKLLGKPVIVHPHNRISGAIGAALAVKEAALPGPSSFRGLGAVEAVEIRTFECKACSNVCQVSKIRSGDRIGHFGDTCERFTSGAAGKAPGVLPDLVGEVEDLLLSYAGGEGALGTAGIPRASVMYDLLPFWSSLLKSLGFRVVVSETSAPQTLEEGLSRVTAETCLPIKLAYGHVAALMEREDVDFVFLPSILDLRDQGDARSHLCPFEESIGFMVSTFAADKMVVPAVYLAAPRPRMVRELAAKLGRFGLDEERIAEALDRAWEAQTEFDRRLQERGREVLSKDFGIAFAILGKPYNVVDAFQNLNLSARIAKLGILSIPMQMLPRPPLDLDSHGVTIPWSYNRNALRALLEAAADRRLFPVIVSNFGCGPDAFALKYLEGIDTPFLYLEFDEHRGEAGLVTRLEAFVDEITEAGAARASKQVALRKAPQRRRRRFEGRRFVIPHFADHAWAYYGALKFADHEVVMLPPPDEEALSRGEEVSSGKECHPYFILAGDLMKHVDRGTIRPGDIYLFPGTQIACLLSEYESAMRLALARRGVRDVEVLAPSGKEQIDILGTAGGIRLGRGLIAIEQLVRLKWGLRPYAVDPERVDRLFDRLLRRSGEAIGKDRLGDVLRSVEGLLAGVERIEGPLRPLVGVAGDIYTRTHPFGNRDLFRKLEALGFEVWPAPFLLDVTEFGWRRAVSGGLDEGNYRDAAGATLLLLRKQIEALRVRFLLGARADRAQEPGYEEILSMAEPYVDRGANNVVVLNVAKMVDFARRGAHGIVNAVSFHCMLGTVSASLAEKVRRDHDMIPLTTLVYTGKASPEIDTKLEAFAHQVHSFARRSAERAEEARPARGWLAGLLD